MINFFKKLFAAIFGKKTTVAPSIKPLKEEPIVPLDEMKMPKESKTPLAGMVKLEKKYSPRSNFFPFTGSKKWQMRNNRLHIEYNGKARGAGSNYDVQKNELGQITRVNRPGSMYKGKINSLRCTQLAKAEKTIRLFRACIERAVFTDKDGNQHQLI